MNKNSENKDIITALSTPYGRSAVAVIRISGDGSKELTEKYLERKLENGKLKLNIFKTEKFSERLMAVYNKAPKTYTGEETVELYPHGNMTVCDGIIKTLINGGARIAERGEFTKRAFLNGKMDLMQCEALADIIDAQTAEQLNYGNKRFDGGFKAIGEVEEILKTALSSIEAILHYGDELEENEIDEELIKNVTDSIDNAILKLEKEENGFVGGKIVKEGFRIALIGEPNVGKSTLLNALTESDRAIVTDIAGTTRDTVDGEFIYKDKKFIVTDTAGINDDTTDTVEKIGIERAYGVAENADAVVLVTAKGIKAKELFKTKGKIVTVENKNDGIKDVGEEYDKAEMDGVLPISGKYGSNITALKQKLYDLCPKDYGSISNHRQYDCVVRCLDSLKAARKERDKTDGLEIVAALLYEAYSAMTELYGEKADEKVISAVFERFCVGK